MTSDEQQIRNLCYGYAELLDRGDHAELGRLFARGEVECFVEGNSDGPNVGESAVRCFYDGAVILHDGNPRTRHVITNLILDIDDRARKAEARSYFQVVQKADGVPLQIIASGRYCDLCAKDEDGWYFLAKRIDADFAGNVSKHSASVARKDPH